MKTIKKTIKYIGLFLLALIIYGLLVSLLSFIPVNTIHSVNDEPKIEIYILSNGVHTDIVVPVNPLIPSLALSNDVINAFLPYFDFANSTAA